MSPTLAALLLCVAAAIAEGLCAGAGVRQRLSALRVPRFALPFPAWVAIGLLYYLACFVILRALLAPELVLQFKSAATWLLLFLMAYNAAWNYFFFQRQALRVSWLLSPPYSLLVLVEIGLLWSIRPTAAYWLMPYGLYQVYANLWVYAVWRLNDPPHRSAV